MLLNPRNFANTIGKPTLLCSEQSKASLGAAWMEADSRGPYFCEVGGEIGLGRSVTDREPQGKHRRRRSNDTSEPFRRPDAYADGFALRMEQRVL